MDDIRLTYRFLVDDQQSADDGEFWVLLFHEVLYDAPKPVNIAGWFGEHTELYEWMRQDSQAPRVTRDRPLTWPELTVSRRRSSDGWAVQLRGRPLVSGVLGLHALFG
jgi:hypothetical protein